MHKCETVCMQALEKGTRSSDVKPTTAEGRTTTSAVHLASDDARRELQPAVEPSKPNQPTNDVAAQSSVMVEEKGARREKRARKQAERRASRQNDGKGRLPFAEDNHRHRDELPSSSILCVCLSILSSSLLSSSWRAHTIRSILYHHITLNLFKLSLLSWKKLMVEIWCTNGARPTEKAAFVRESILEVTSCLLFDLVHYFELDQIVPFVMKETAGWKSILYNWNGRRG